MSNYITFGELVAINEYVVTRYITSGEIGIKDVGILKNVVSRPSKVIDEKEVYGTVFEKAVALLESIVKVCPFKDGNNGTALLATYAFLYRNEYELKMNCDFAENLILGFIKERYSYELMVRVIEDSCVKKDSIRKVI